MASEEVVRKWILADAKLKAAKAAELELRKEICEFILDGKTKGAKKGTIGPFQLTATGKVNDKIDKAELKVLWPDLSPAERQSIKFTPSIVAAEYKRLPKDSKVHRVVTSTPGTPSLSIKA